MFDSGVLGVVIGLILVWLLILVKVFFIHGIHSPFSSRSNHSMETVPAGFVLIFPSSPRSYRKRAGPDHRERATLHLPRVAVSRLGVRAVVAEKNDPELAVLRVVHPVVDALVL
jgi:hypothetical protein